MLMAALSKDPKKAMFASPVGYDDDVIELGIPGEIIDDAY